MIAAPSIRWAISALLLSAVSARAETLATAIPAPPAEVVQPFQFTLSNDFRYFSFSGNRAYPHYVNTAKGSGSQFYAPVTLEAVGNLSPDFTLDTLIRSGYAYSRQSSPNFSGSVSTATDTSITNTLTYLGYGTVQPFLSLALNLPTGTSGLFGAASRARLDSDLVDLGTFGEGFNIGPSIGVNIAINSELVSALTLGYTHRGDYDSDLESLDPINPQAPGSRFSPGDLFTFSPTLAYQSGPLTLVGAGSIAYETDTLRDGQHDYRTGYQALLSVSGTYRWAEDWLTSFAGSYQHIGSNKNFGQLPNGLGGVGLTPYELEAFNSNSDRFKIDLEQDYLYGALAIGPTAGFLYRDHNAYDPLNLLYLPAKTQWKVGGRALYTVNDKLSLTLRGEHAWTHEGAKQSDILVDPLGLIAAGSDPTIRIQSWEIALSTVYKF